MSGWIRRGLATALLTGLALTMTGPLPAHAADTSTVYEALVDEGIVRVTVSTAAGAISLPPGATNVSATIDGEPVEPTIVEGPSAIGVGVDEPGALVVAFDLPNSSSDAADTIKANAAYVWFPTWVWGDPGAASVEIRVPSDFQIKVDGAVLETAQVDGWTVMSAREITDPAGWDVTVSARKDGSLVTEIAQVDDFTYVIRSWPGEDAWVTRMRSLLDLALPELADLTGIDDPIGRPLVVAQSTDPQRNGFDGWYVAATDTIEVGTDPDVHVLVHEASHAWFNDTITSERWFAEGLAEAYTALVEPALGRTPGEPSEPPSEMIRLAEWDHTTLIDQTTVDMERAAYAASWWVVDALVDDIGIDGMRGALADLAGRRSAYAGPGFTVTDTPADWRRVLDVLDANGATAADEIIGTRVAPVIDAPLLATRATLRERYAALADDSLGWMPPIGVRTAMDEWNFTLAGDRIDAAFAFLAYRDGLVADGAEVGSLRASYERATTPVIPAVEAASRVAESSDAAPAGRTALWTLTAIAALALGGWVITRRQAQPAPISTVPIDPSAVDELGSQMALFSLPTSPDPGRFTLIDLDVLARLDEELDGIEQQVLFEAPTPPGPITAAADPWADVLKQPGTIRF